MCRYTIAKEIAVDLNIAIQSISIHKFYTWHLWFFKHCIDWNLQAWEIVSFFFFKHNNPEVHPQWIKMPSYWHFIIKIPWTFICKRGLGVYNYAKRRSCYGAYYYSFIYKNIKYCNKSPCYGWHKTISLRDGL